MVFFHTFGVDEAVDKLVENPANPHQKRAAEYLVKKQPSNYSTNKINKLQVKNRREIPTACSVKALTTVVD